MKRVSYLDGIRGFGLIAVMVMHWAVLSGMNPIPGGYVVVDTFFVLSGFLITAILFNSREHAFRGFYRRFIKARITRLYPALLAVVVIVFVISNLAPVQDQARLRPLGAVAVLGQFSWLTWLKHGETGHVLDQCWSLGAEWSFYLAWPVALWFFRRRPRLGMWITIFTAVVAYLMAVTVLGIPWLYWSPLGRADQLLAGSALALYYVSRGESPLWSSRSTKHPAVAVAFFGSMMLVVTWVVFAPWFDSPLYPFLGHPGSAIATVVLVASGRVYVGPGHGILSRGPARVAGIVSYSTYLWHWPVLLMLKTPAFGLSPVVFTLLAVVLTATTSGLSFWFLERPRMISRSRSPDAARSPAASGVPALTRSHEPLTDLGSPLRRRLRAPLRSLARRKAGAGWVVTKAEESP
jgi:peptidoglycan/LPS O-acetylase OafA/YrhL